MQHEKRLLESGELDVYHDAEASKDNNLRWKYGISFFQWEELFEKQGRVCAICGRDDPAHTNGWATDHNHETGKVRGILCQKCQPHAWRRTGQPRNSSGRGNLPRRTSIDRDSPLSRGHLERLRMVLDCGRGGHPPSTRTSNNPWRG